MACCQEDKRLARISLVGRQKCQFKGDEPLLKDRSYLKQIRCKAYESNQRSVINVSLTPYGCFCLLSSLAALRVAKY